MEAMKPLLILALITSFIVADCTPSSSAASSVGNTFDAPTAAGSILWRNYWPSSSRNVVAASLLPSLRLRSSTFAVVQQQQPLMSVVNPYHHYTLPRWSRSAPTTITIFDGDNLGAATRTAAAAADDEDNEQQHQKRMGGAHKNGQQLLLSGAAPSTTSVAAAAAWTSSANYGLVGDGAAFRLSFGKKR